MNFMESFKSAVQSVRANKMRSFLTMLGIIIGISSVITIVAIGQGGQQAILGEFENLGKDVININVKSNNNDIEKRDYLTLEDAKTIKEKMPIVKDVIPASYGMGHVKTEKDKKFVEIDGTTPGIAKITNVKMAHGRFLNDRDLESARNVAVIDDITALKLYKTTNIVGEVIKLNVKDNNMNFVVVGVMKNPNGNMAVMFGDNMPGTVYIPITVADKILDDTNIAFFAVTVHSMENSEETASQIIRLLEMAHRNSGKYAAEEGFKQLDMLKNVLGILTAVIGAIAGISLLVGGIGVMNIMLVSVTERTREIGIRKALGAKRKDIRLQFLTESLILCLIGGIIGMLLGVGAGMLIGKAINVKAGVSPGVILIAFGFSSAVGIFFGLYPANKAAKLDPIEALRYE